MSDAVYLPATACFDDTEIATYKTPQFLKNDF
jgi:hypothetical protein